MQDFEENKAKSAQLDDPKALFKKDTQLLDKPFFFQGNNKKAVLLIHGWTVVPYEVRRLGMFLNENGYTAHGPMLKGHGTVPKNLEGVRWTEWLEDVESAYEDLRKDHDQVFVVGTSIGSNLVSVLSTKKPEIPGVVLMAMPGKLRMERTVILFAEFMSLFQKYKKKFYPPTFGSAHTITRLISYQTYPVRSALETFDLIKFSRKILPEIKQPCLVMQSSSDHIVSRDNLEFIYSNIGSQNKKKKYIRRAYHTFISDIKNEHVFEDILSFIEKN